MLKSIIIAAIVSFAAVSQASVQKVTVKNVAKAINAQIFANSQINDWKVGDQASYSLVIGSFIKGSMVMGVKAYDSNGLLLTQNMDLGFAGKQNCEVLIDTSTGQTKKMTCNGQDQDPGQAGEIEVIEMKEATITVPAGTFECAHIRAKNKKDDSEIQQWVNPTEIPVLGLIKSLMPSQFGEVNVELTSFKKMN